jgi:hypothetical protein
MLANTLTLTVAGATGSPFTLTRVNQDNYGSEYRYLDSVQLITMKIRQSTDSGKSSAGVALPINRHNATIEHTIFATPSVAEKVCTATITLRDSQGYGPTTLLAFWVGFNTLFLTLDDAVVVGDN